ncbi:MAG: VWA domain-containing protein [Blastocatellia bacterium]|nr:VWA domain-containing protein [Blastocatellia bacterium]
MKIPTLKIKIVFLSSFLLLFLSSVFAQTSPNRITDFGNSLKKYGKKDRQETNKDNSQDSDVIKVETNLVVNDVLIADKNGTPVTNLKKEDFIITEDGVPQNVSLFSFGENAEMPRSIVLLIDYSTSLLPYIESSTKAAKVLIDKMNPRDKMAIVTDDVEILIDFTDDKTLLRETLDNLVLKCLSGNKVGKSMPFSALLATLNELFDGAESRPTIIFQSDGDEFALLKPIKYFSDFSRKDFIEECKTDKWFCERNFGFSDVTEKIEKSNVTIYSVIPGVRFAGIAEEEKLKRGVISTANRLRAILAKPDEKFISKFSKEYAPTEAKEKSAWQTSMVETANLSGGYASYLEKPEDGEMIYSNIFQVIENRYVIGYYPKNEQKDGKWRKVRIEIKNHPEYVIMGRKSYIAPSEQK